MQRRITLTVLSAALPLAAGYVSGCSFPVADATPQVGAQSQTRVAVLPTPPQQTAAWQKPTGADAEGLPPELLTATETLFAQGLADPRGCDYKAIVVQVGDVWRGDAGTVTTHGWVLPPSSGSSGGKAFAVCWNGLVYPVVSIKGEADVNADMQALLEKAKPKGAGSDRFGYTLMWSHATPEAASLALEYPSLLKAVYLLRLGEWKAARDFYRVWEAGTPPRVNGNDDIRRDPYLSLASQWAWSAYDRAVCAHMRGADALAGADADLLTRVQPLIEAEATKRGYKTYPNGAIHTDNTPFLGFLANLPALRQDATRRVTETQPATLDLKTLKERPQPERIAALIQHLQDVDARQSGQPGGVGLDAHPVSQALIAEGDAAVEVLLDTMEKDQRLTRSVSFPRDFFAQRNLLSVKDAAWACFARITDVTQIGDGKPTVADLRQWWAKNKGVTMADRWYSQLADDGPPTKPLDPTNLSYDERTRQERAQFEQVRNNQRRWSEAAARIVERSNITRSGGWVSVPLAKPGQPIPPFKGEALRRRQNPSVSELLLRRAMQLSEPTEGRWGFDFANAATLALMLYEWDPKGPQTLPTLQTVMQRCMDFQNKQKKEPGYSDQYQLGGRIARLTVARIRLGDTVAATQYGTYLKSVTPQYLGHETQSALFALAQQPDNPAVRAVARDVFAPQTKNAWSELLADPNSRGGSEVSRTFSSDLLRLEPFRQLVLRRLRDKTEAGIVKPAGSGAKHWVVAWKDGSSESSSHLESGPPRQRTLRTCDRVAYYLQNLQGVPRFDIYGTEAERDVQCAAIAAYLTRYGDSFGRATALASPLYGHDSGAFGTIGPTFAALTRPATAADVRQNRALFTLSGGRTRVAPDLPASLPLEAEWNRDPNANIATQANGKKISWSRGLIWQAEDQWDGTKWMRYYGYIGPHSIARVPANQIQITDYRARKPALPESEGIPAKMASVPGRSRQ